MNNFTALILMALFSTSVASANVTQINRYATVANQPLPAQVNPLLAIQQIHFPQTVQTVGQAVNWWLQYSGFSLAKPPLQMPSLQEVLRQPLPQVQKNLGPLSVQDGLQVLVGVQVFEIVVDPIQREINFKEKPSVGRKV